MGMESSLKVTFVLAAVVAAGLSKTILLSEVAEICPGNFITQDYNGWDITNKTINSTFYIPMASKYAALMLSLNLLRTQQFEEINEKQLESSCITMRNTAFGVNYTGYNKETSVFSAIPTTKPKLFRVNFGFPDLATGAGELSIALSDNESYTVYDNCFNNGLRSFFVASTTQSLDTNKRNIIKAHMRSLGFREEHMLELNYGDCIEKDGILVTSKDDLPKAVTLQALPVLGYNHIKKLVVPSYVVG